MMVTSKQIGCTAHMLHFRRASVGCLVPGARAPEVMIKVAGFLITSVQRGGNISFLFFCYFRWVLPLLGLVTAKTNCWAGISRGILFSSLPFYIELDFDEKVQQQLRLAASCVEGRAKRYVSLLRKHTKKKQYLPDVDIATAERQKKGQKSCLPRGQRSLRGGIWLRGAEEVSFPSLSWLHKTISNSVAFPGTETCESIAEFTGGVI